MPAGNPSRTLCLSYNYGNGLQVPTSLTNLSALTDLNIGVRHVGNTFQMSWLTQLAALQSVAIGFNNTDHLTVTNLKRLESLTGLISLQLRNSSSDYNVTVEVDWGSCLALESLLVSGSFTFRPSGALSQVAALQRLQEVTLMGLMQHGENEAAKIALAHTLGRDRPDVLFMCS